MNTNWKTAGDMDWCIAIRGSVAMGTNSKKANFKDWGNGPASDILSALEDASSNTLD